MRARRLGAVVLTGLLAAENRARDGADGLASWTGARASCNRVQPRDISSPGATVRRVGAFVTWDAGAARDQALSSIVSIMTLAAAARPSRLGERHVNRT